MGQRHLRDLPAAGKRRLDRAHVWPGVERLAGKEDAATRISQHRERFSGFRRSVGIGAAGKFVLAPIDRPRGHKTSAETLGGRAKDLAE